jgi:FkbM family methyltransferase
MGIRTLLRWLIEFPRILTVLSFRDGMVPLLGVRFGSRPTAHIQVRRLGRLTIVNRLSAMVFLNIWVRHEYPTPTARDVVLDLGANVGLFSIFALSHGAQFCHCVEPCPASVKHLEAHIKGFGFQDRTNVMLKAVGAVAGSGFIPSTSNVNNVVSQEKASGLVQVEVADVAGLIDSLSPKPTYIKFDIEKNEIPVLRRLLSSTSIASVQTVAVEAMTEAESIASLLEQSGFMAKISPHPSTIILGVRPG